MRKKNLILSADDFGLNEKSNRNILDMAKAGKLDRVAVMPFGNFSEAEVRELAASGVKLDIHLHLERKKPDSFENRGLDQGTLTRVGIFLGLFLRSGNMESARSEWREQFDEFFRVFGRKPDGMNSHEHIHYFPPYFRLALEFQKKFSFSYFRFGKEGITGRSAAAGILKFLSCQDRRILKNEQVAVPTSDYFTSFDWIANPESFMNNVSDGTSVEILFHPMRDEEYESLKKKF